MMTNRQLVKVKHLTISYKENTVQRGIFSLEAIEPSEVILMLYDGLISTQPTRFSIQIGECQHLSGKLIWALNHHCFPNIYLDVSEHPILSVRALGAIQVGEELTFNYLTTEYDLHEPFKCDCGFPRCYGIIRGFKYLSAEQQATLSDFLLPHLRAKLLVG